MIFRVNNDYQVKHDYRGEKDDCWRSSFKLPRSILGYPKMHTQSSGLDNTYVAVADTFN